jgi:opacity protein-like surface antigen
MTSMLRYHLAAFLLLVLPAVSRAAEGRGYAGAQAGMFLPIKSSVTGNFVGEGATVTFNPGVLLALVGGYQFANGLRAEGELNYRRLTTDKLINLAGQFPADSDIWSYGFMSNLYYDFRNRTVITPYVGGGLGMTVVRFEKGSSGARTLWTSDEDLTVAYQGIAGFELRLADATSLDFAYRHFAVPHLHFNTLSAEFRGINVTLGIRHWF